MWKKKYIFFFQNRYPILVKCFNIWKNIGKPIYRSISILNVCIYPTANNSIVFVLQQACVSESPCICLTSFVGIIFLAHSGLKSARRGAWQWNLWFWANPLKATRPNSHRSRCNLKSANQSQTVRSLLQNVQRPDFPTYSACARLL